MSSFKGAISVSRPALRTLLVVLGVAAGSQIYGQADRATIEGIVTDATGAAVPDASVIVTRTETNAGLSLRTNELGRYYAANLPLGTYRVTAEKTGFRPARVDNLILQSQMNVRADISLQVGAVADAIEVTAEAPMLDASTATITSQMTNKQIQELPLIVIGRKRDITAYLQFLPGVTTASTWGARVNGSNPGNSEVFLDGAPASQGNVRGGIQENGPAVEQVGEFSVVTNSFNAEYGRTGSWFTNITIKSGTNQLHGSLFNYFDNDKLNARSFFQQIRSRVRHNEGGGTIGGPVYIPKVYDGRNKTFFFFGQQLVYYTNTESGSLFTVPRDDFRAGNFSRFSDSAGVQIPVFDPLTTQPDGKGSFVRGQFPGNVIPAIRISPVSRKIVDIIPLADLPSEQLNNFRNRTGSGTYRNYVSTIKVDHNFTDAHKLSVTYTDQYNPRVIAGQGYGVDNPLEGSQSPKYIHSRTGRINYDWIVRPNLLSHFTFGADRYNNQTQQLTQFEGWNQQLGIQGVLWDQGAFPVIGFSGGTASPRGMGGGDFSTNANGRYTFTETVAWTKGRHTIKFGGNYWPEYANGREGYQSSGAFNFSNLLTSQPNSNRYTSWGNSFAAMLLGNLSSASISEPYARGARFRSMALFAQDEWRVTNTLTLSYGLRWEGNTAPFEPNGATSGFSRGIANPVAGGRLGALLFGGEGSGRSGSRALSDGWFKGFGPRLGIAYQVTPKTVIRASGGIYYAPGFRTRLIAYGYTNNNSRSSSTGYDAIYNWTNDGYPSDFPRAPFINPSFQNGQNVSSILPGTSRMPQILTWTFSVQRELAKDLSFEGTYIGSHSTHLVLGGAQSNLNTLDTSYLSLGNLLFQDISSSAAAQAGFTPPYPAFTRQPNHTVGQSLRSYPQYLNVNEEWGPHGVARFNSMQLKLTKRYSSGLTLLAFYTWSKNMTNVEGGPIDLGAGDGSIQNPNNRASEVSVSSEGPPHVFVASGSYELPFGPGKPFLNTGGFAGHLVGGWQISAYVRYTDGAALAVTGGNALSALGIPAIRANYVGGDVYKDKNPREFDPAINLYLNAAAFQTPSTFSLGNTARVLDWVRGFTGKSESLSVAKRFRVSEGVRALIRADAQNPFNFVRWNNPNTSITSSNFGKVTGAASGRTIQLGASIEF
ncbi:MAG: TonB-dependent receptor [Bryobacterales bacterium]|nr:TonB-dependent receptor [Bryobacterales bacterium]